MERLPIGGLVGRFSSLSGRGHKVRVVLRHGCSDPVSCASSFAVLVAATPSSSPRLHRPAWNGLVQDLVELA